MSEKTHVKYTVSSYAVIKKPWISVAKTKGRKNGKFDSHPGLVFVLAQFKSSLFSCKLNWKGARLIPLQMRKRIHIPSTVQPRFFYFAFKILNADKILLPGSSASFLLHLLLANIFVLIPLFNWRIPRPTNPSSVRRTYWVWRYECDGNNFHSYLSRDVKVIGSYKLISLLNRMDVFLAEIKKPPAPVGKLNQFQVCVCSKYSLFGGEGWEGGLFDSKPSIAQLTPTRSC